jgi:hypothetical protein
MNKYFFDLVNPQRSEYDFRGGEFPTPDSALQLAELIALDLAIEPESKWSGWTVEVRNPFGQPLFSIPVPGPNLVAT